jgi:hypothetical protein
MVLRTRRRRRLSCSAAAPRVGVPSSGCPPGSTELRPQCGPHDTRPQLPGRPSALGMNLLGRGLSLMATCPLQGQRPTPGLGWGDSNSGPSRGVSPAHGHVLALTCGFSQPVVTAGARRVPLAAGRVCTQRVPLAPIPSGRGGSWRSGQPPTRWSQASCCSRPTTATRAPQVAHTQVGGRNKG